MSPGKLAFAAGATMLAVVFVGPLTWLLVYLSLFFVAQPLEEAGPGRLRAAPRCPPLRS